MATKKKKTKKKKTVTVNFMLPEDIAQEIKDIASLAGVSQNAVINVILATKMLQVKRDG